MRIFLLPISTAASANAARAGRNLIYCEQLNVSTTDSPSYLDKATTKAAALWAGWEKKESGWQKKVVVYGNEALKRIPYEEWGLKSIPPLSQRRKDEELSAASEKVEVSFPSTLIAEGKVTDVLRQLGTERKQLHRSRLIWSFVGMPLVAPFALVPIIPNLPFFYLVYRAWSHWRALRGSEHIEFLLKNELVLPKPSKILEELYATGSSPFNDKSTATASANNGQEVMLLHVSDGKRIGDALQVPALQTELDRAIWQVERALSEEKKLRQEKSKSNSESEKEKTK